MIVMKRRKSTNVGEGQKQRIHKASYPPITQERFSSQAQCCIVRVRQMVTKHATRGKGDEDIEQPSLTTRIRRTSIGGGRRGRRRTRRRWHRMGEAVCWRRNRRRRRWMARSGWMMVGWCACSPGTNKSLQLSLEISVTTRNNIEGSFITGKFNWLRSVQLFSCRKT